MSRAVRLSEQLVNKASTRAKAVRRSTAGQIEYWAHIGQIAEENPDLPYSFIQNILIALEEKKSKKLSEYEFSKGE